MNVTRAAPLTSPILRSYANPASLGSNALIAAVPGRRIRVISASVVAAGAVAVKFLTGSTDLSSLKSLAANGGFVLPFNEHGWYETAVGEALNLNLSGAVAVGIDFQYMVL